MLCRFQQAEKQQISQLVLHPNIVRLMGLFTFFNKREIEQDLLFDQIFQSFPARFSSSHSSILLFVQKIKDFSLIYLILLVSPYLNAIGPSRSSIGLAENYTAPFAYPKIKSSKHSPLTCWSTLSHPKKHLAMTLQKILELICRISYLTLPYSNLFFSWNSLSHLYEIQHILGIFSFNSSKENALEITFLLFFRDSPSLKTIPSPSANFKPAIIIFDFVNLLIPSIESTSLMRSGLTKIMKGLSSILVSKTSKLKQIFLSGQKASLCSLQHFQADPPLRFP